MDVHLVLDPHGSRRDALERALRAAIREGRLAAGTRVPSSRALALDLGIARGTVVEAYSQLRAEGYLEARQGSGTRVAAVSTPVPRAPAPRQSGISFRFSFNPGTPDLTAFPAQAWTRALRRALARTPAAALGYGDPRGRPELRTELAVYLARARGVVVDPELVVVCAGFRHGLALLARALRSQGATRVAMEEPGFDAHVSALATGGLEVVPLPVDADGARTDLLPGLDVAAAVLAPAHQYPLGVVLRPERRAAAAAWAHEHDALVVEDDFDGELRYDRQPVGALQALAPDHVAYGGTASKTLAPGLRLGWLVLPPALLDAVVALRLAEDMHVAVPEQLVLAELLRSGIYERHVRRMRSRYRTRRERLLALLAARAPEVRPSGIAAGLRVLLELPDGVSAQEVVRRGAARSLELFPAGEQALVVGYGALSEHDVGPGLDALVRLLAETVAEAPPR